MGVGKMIISVMLIAKHLDEIQPVMIVCKSTIMVQWAKKIASWAGVPCQVIDSGKDDPLWGLAKVIIISYDLLRRVKWLEEANQKVKTLIVDEVQNVKNHDAKRTQHLMKLAKGIKYVIGLSGTPIKNHAREYGPILMMVRPDKFPSQAKYERDWVSPSGYMYNPRRFQEFTSDFILRYTRKEVLPDIPEITRQYEYHNMSAEVEAAYQATLEEFTEFYAENGMSSFKSYGEGLAYLSKMRHLTGLAKAGPVSEWADEFLSSTDEKLTIFVHHKDVAMTIINNLKVYNPLILRAEQNAAEREKVCTDFWKPENRLLVASTLVGGEGINLQCCANLILAERQWNPANEEQAEARFPRPGQKSDKIRALYPVAVGTIDEFFARLVEKKRELCTEIIDGRKVVAWTETDVVREMGRILAEQGMRAWQTR
jgi:SNF2 family DNA or RNA helicase